MQRHTSWIAILTLAGACGGPGGGPKDAPDGFDRRALLTNEANNVILPIQSAFAAKAAALPGAIGAYCTALDANLGASPDAARAAWTEAMDAWQAGEAVLVGPAAMNKKTLRDKIYSWPLQSTCGIDRDTASRFADPASYNVATKLANVRSLFAIEYLLYTTNTDHMCAATPDGWDALGANLPRARCRLAAAIAQDVATEATALDTTWRPDGGNYAGELAGASSAQEAINQISDAMFYVDTMVKDMKLAEAAGIAMNACGVIGEPCLREVEHPFGDRATFAIRINLRVLREAFSGTTATTDGPGFDDFLTTLGHGDVADRMLGKLDAAIAAADALPDSFLAALANDLPKVIAAHAALRAFTDDLKSQFLTLLDLAIPDDVQGDND
ncbi:MAG: imelysin family protein [Deltaproteobacteria bacterium]|nr:imelysin family protein [Deltaproteobacteria bacterium]